jgi:hypothetical protein
MPGRRTSDIFNLRIAIVRMLFYLNTVIWFCLGTYLVLYMLYQQNGFSAVWVGFFLYGNAAAMFISGRYIGQRQKWAYYFGLFVLLVNALVTRIGHFGVFDMFALILDIAIFCALLLIASPYLKRS